MKNRVLPCLVLIAAAMLNAQFQAPPPPVPERNPAKPGSVTLTVINSVTQQPIADVRVTLSPWTGAGEPIAGETDASGRVQLISVPPGSYRYNLSTSFGFPGPPRRDPIVVKEGGSITVPPVELIPPGGIEGIVTDEEGNPVAGAEVEATGFLTVAVAVEHSGPFRAEYFASTDESGHYRLSNVRPGPMIVRISMPQTPGIRRFPVTYYPGVHDVKQTLRLQVLPGRDVEHTDFRVRFAQGFHVRGRVAIMTPPQELPTLFIRSCDSLATGASVEMADDGSFDFPDMIPGAYCLRYQELRLSDNAIVSHAATQVAVIDRDVERVQLNTEIPHTMSGIVQLDEGVRMPETVQLNTETGMPGSSTQFDRTTGRFTVEGLFAANYRLIVPVAGYVKSASLSGREIDPAGFAYGGESGPLVIHIARATGILHGRVTGLEGKSMGGRIVVVARLGRTTEITHGLLTNDQGEFTITGIAPGSYKVFVWETEDNWIRIQAFLDRFAGTTVTVKDNQQTEVETRMIPAAEVERVQASF